MTVARGSHFTKHPRRVYLYIVYGTYYTLLHLECAMRATLDDCQELIIISSISTYYTLLHLECAVRATLDECQELIDSDGLPELLPLVVDGLVPWEGELDHVHLLGVGAVRCDPRGRCALMHRGELEWRLRRVARQVVDPLKDAHAAPLEALELDGLRVLAVCALLDVNNVVWESDAEARLLYDAGRSRLKR